MRVAAIILLALRKRYEVLNIAGSEESEASQANALLCAQCLKDLFFYRA
jgi:hypothetical protein